MNSLSFWKKSVYSALVFFGTLIILSVGYAAWNVAMSKVTAGNPLSATSWNALVDNIADLDSRWSRVGGGIAFTGGNVGIGTTSPSERLDLWGGNIKMGLSYQNNITIATSVASQTMSPSYQICPTGASVIGGTCWTTGGGNVACPAYYGIGGNANIQAWNCSGTSANVFCSAICANMK